MVSIPYPGPREAIPSPEYCSVVGVDIANPLFRHIYIEAVVVSEVQELTATGGSTHALQGR